MNKRVETSNPSFEYQHIAFLTFAVDDVQKWMTSPNIIFDETYSNFLVSSVEEARRW